MEMDPCNVSEPFDDYFFRVETDIGFDDVSLLLVMPSPSTILTRVS